ncbi:hypothetical protein Ade02nite_85460 [Paractinoplanes deccanensis]|uniref:SIR2-like domain-containing protein n=1 Tax=Paractinoplanes deccanensis TaxID=113561 RepID=A0ABQ3YJC7_9ACTN|nr:hypothetical protein Ade02nite_85460 [Actinoplanes deccanensis]
MVLFVGAGASADPPSGLPMFGALTERVATATHHDFDKAELHQPDVLLGRIEDRGGDVHRIIKTIIGDPASRPNALHRAIARLASSGEPVRIVTTNYDLHLSTALRERGVSFTEYRGPAVPMGDDFTGVVYLHGDLTQEPRHLIATEGDLGRAYLTDAWAARFVERMFAEYTVLFIGYSHSDTVMRLIARGIGGTRRPRYALTDQADLDVWKTYKVVPITYEVVGRSHAALADALDGWAALTSMGLLDHRQRIAGLVGAAPSLVPEDVSYLEDALGDQNRTRFFTELADDPAWLSWAAQRPQFQAMFRSDAPFDQCTVLLAHWYVGRFVMDEARSAQALSILHDGGGQLAPVLCGALGQHLHRRPGSRPDWLGPWLALLLEHAGEADTHWLEYALLKSAAPADRPAALLLLQHLTEPRLRQRPLYAGTKPSFEVVLRGSLHHLDEAWAGVFRPALDATAVDVLTIADRQLRRISELLTLAGAARPGWDPVSFGRYAIEDDQGDRYREAADVLIDAARDCVEALLTAGAPSGPGYLDAWAASGVLILRRLALHGWTHRTDVNATAKLAWLRSTGWLFDHQVRPELFRLIRETLPAASADEVEALVSDVRTLPVAGDDESHVAYLRFNALTWILRSVPGLPSARAALDEILARYPRFEPRDHPEQLRSRVEFMVVPDQPPMTVEELHERIAADPAAAVSELRRYEHVEVPFDGPGWDDAVRVLAATVHDHPADGFAILDLGASLPAGIVSAVIDGWSAASLEPPIRAGVLRRLRSLDLEAVADSVSRLLLAGTTASGNATKWHLVPGARELAGAVWDVLGPVGPPDDGRDWPSLAINRPAGRIAEFWLHAVSEDWTAAGDAWTGLPPHLRLPLETMVGDSRGPEQLAQPVLAGHLAFLAAADRPWCERVLLPMMAWADEERAVRAWSGYLGTSRIAFDLFEAGLRGDYLDAIELADRLPDDLSRALPMHLAVIALRGPADPLTWVEAFTARAGERQRTAWMSSVADLLGDLTPDAVDEQWRRWMRRYWQRRLESVPAPLTFAEASALATWVPHLAGSLGEGVTLATAHRAGITERHTLHDWPGDRLAREPELFARLLAHLLTGTTPPIWEDVPRVALAVRDGAAPGDFTIIRNEALRLGFSAAADW